MHVNAIETTQEAKGEGGRHFDVKLFQETSIKADSVTAIRNSFEKKKADGRN